MLRGFRNSNPKPFPGRFLSWGCRANVMNAESFSFMRFFEWLVKPSSPRLLGPSDHRANTW